MTRNISKLLILFSISLSAFYASGHIGAKAHKKVYTSYAVDNVHSSVGFLVSHMVVSRTRGIFDDFTGLMKLGSEGKLHSLDGVVKVKSLSTRNEKRDRHLLSADFFNAAKYPEMVLTSTKIHQQASGKFKLEGDMKIRDQTRPVSFSGEFREPIVDPWGNKRAGLTLEGTINRMDYGMTWSKLMDAGGLVVGEDVIITLELEVIEKKKEPAK
ncbi:polyisoprenoid-binding protein [bacterium]|jgi:polyisoprenoid-binding protein YceI|nr:polyisoprenoid-binding protein [bacterium]